MLSVCLCASVWENWVLYGFVRADKMITKEQKLKKKTDNVYFKEKECLNVYNILKSEQRRTIRPINMLVFGLLLFQYWFVMLKSVNIPNVIK